jgi:hypothetical protein
MWSVSLYRAITWNTCLPSYVISYTRDTLYTVKYLSVQELNSYASDLRSIQFLRISFIELSSEPSQFNTTRFWHRFRNPLFENLHYTILT